MSLETTDVRTTPSRRALIGKLAFTLSLEGFPRGDLAALRQMTVAQPSVSVFWRLLTTQGICVDDLSNEDIKRWALILKGMALMAPRHQSATSVGAALLSAGYKEERLMRLLNSRGHQFDALLLRACRQLASAGQPIDWRQLGELVLSQGRYEDAAEQVRLDIARRYYSG